VLSVSGCELLEGTQLRVAFEEPATWSDGVFEPIHELALYIGAHPNRVAIFDYQRIFGAER
jgi:hypothetical protein